MAQLGAMTGQTQVEHDPACIEQQAGHGSGGGRAGEGDEFH